MGMSIDDSERHLRLMLGGMEYAVEYWKDKDKEESDIEQTNVEAVKTALETMRKYQTMQEVLEKVWNVPSCMLDEAECLNKIMETYRTVR
ncbi:hypothetical protein [Butyrivibrio sp.]|uniref:hypothetical protein n=1 Tax=Butyrivibrio sp. TaxID=28121 RepID=UPI0025BC3BE4|nr:hypothetical protein [Butyrivibrio sp.]MBQ7428357.1 hypothetical protein [Butyrivibrio sp.]MBQ9303661.1 hypothetical protein [Butyrivibrio sp.]